MTKFAQDITQGDKFWTLDGKLVVADTDATPRLGGTSIDYSVIRSTVGGSGTLLINSGIALDVLA